jgi:hypothetical protein
VSPYIKKILYPEKVQQIDRIKSANTINGLLILYSVSSIIAYILRTPKIAPPIIVVIAAIFVSILFLLLKVVVFMVKTLYRSRKIARSFGRVFKIETIWAIYRIT